MPLLDTILAKVVGTQNEREVKRLRPIVGEVNAFEPAIQALTDEQLRGKTAEFRQRLANGETLDSLGPNLGLDGAAFHGHWELCQFLIENGADTNRADPDTGETPLHAALCKANRPKYDLVVKVLLANGAKPNCATKPNVETGGFMRDCRTKGETPLHRAAAFGTEATIQMLLDAGARLDIKDMNGDSPLGWASWYLRPRPILRKLCYGEFHA